MRRKDKQALREGGLSLVVQLQNAIRDNSMTRLQLSRLSGIHDGIISRFVNGHRLPSLATAAKLCAALGLTLVQASNERGRPEKVKEPDDGRDTDQIPEDDHH